MPTPTATRHAAFASIDFSTLTGNLRIKQGTIAKHPRNPLFIQSEPWERRIDNGYPNVVKLPTPRGSSFQLWYGTCARENNCDRQLLLYANSTDGLRWRKPRLGLFDLAAADLPELRAYGRANNILVEAGGVGVFRDEREPNPSLRYKAIGPGCWTSPTLSRVGDVDACGGGAPPPHGGAAGGHQACCRRQLRHRNPDRFVGQRASSPDGLTWSHVANLSWPPPHKWDTHQNAFRDEVSGHYILTTRSIPTFEGSSTPERTISMHASSSSGWEGMVEADTRVPPVITLRGSQDRQPYSQVTWPWLDVYLGLVAVYHPNEASQKVYNRLVWSRVPIPTSSEAGAGGGGGDSSGGGWQWVEGDLSSGPSFIHLGGGSGDESSRGGDVGGDGGEPSSRHHHHQHNSGNSAFDSHIIFAATPISISSSSTQWQHHHRQHHHHNNSNSGGGGGKRRRRRLGEVEAAEDEGNDGGGGSGSGEEWIYYMGGDGPHSGARNSSFALATLRKNGFVCVCGSGGYRTVPLLVTGSRLIVSADFEQPKAASGESWLRIGVDHYERRVAALDADAAVRRRTTTAATTRENTARVGAEGQGGDAHDEAARLRIGRSIPLTHNATDVPMRYDSGDAASSGGSSVEVDLTPLIGLYVGFEVRMRNARLYTIGFETVASSPPPAARRSKGDALSEWLTGA